jgi:FlaA1/EpsC-like NDP-sugar epimerase
MRRLPLSLYANLPSHYLKRVIQEGLLDIAIVYVAYSAAFLVRALTTPLDYLVSLQFFTVAALVTFAMLYLMGTYRRIWARTSGHGVVVIFNAVGLALAVMTVVDLLTEPRQVPVSVLVIANILAFVGFVGIRYRSRLINGLQWRWNAVWHHKFPKEQTRVLIVGAGESGQALAWRLKYRSVGNNYHVVGFVDDDLDKQGMFVEGSQVLGTRHDIERLVVKHKAELIVLAIHKLSGVDLRTILSHCEATKARIKIVPNLFALIDSTAGGELLRDVQIEDLIGRNSIVQHDAVDLTPVTAKVVMITGAAGSIGSELSRQMALYKPLTLILVDNNESDLHDLFLDLCVKHPHVKLVPVLADVTEQEPMNTIFRVHKPQIIFHAAAYKHVPLLQDYPGAAIHTNVSGTRWLAELAQNYNVERFVLISTDKAVNSSSVMGASKRVCELILHAFSQRGQRRGDEQQDAAQTLFTAVRFGNVLGSRGSVVPIFNRQIERGGPVTVTHPDMTRYFMSIPEAVNLVIHAACLTKGDDIFLLKMGEVVRIVELAERMIRLRGLRPHLDIKIEYSGIRPGEKMHEELYESSELVCETIHPHIVQLIGWDDQFNASGFLNELSQLSQIQYMDYDRAAEMLRHLTDMNHHMIAAAD